MAGRTKTCRIPTQARAKAACAAIFEAATRILETEGEDRLTTNRIAELAGVGIGTLYQYFPNKQAILAAIARGEREVWQARAREAVKAGESPARAHVRALVGALKDRPATRRAALKALLTLDPPKAVAPPLDRSVEDFVRSRALLGVVRAAVLEGYPHMHHPAFEDALVRLLESA